MINPNYIKFIEIMNEGVKEGEELSRHTSFKIGGKADLFYSAKDENSLIKAVKTAKILNIPIVIVGDGSNILVSDKGYRGVVIKNRCRGEIKIFNENKIFVYSGFQLSEVLKFAAEHSLSGLEFAAGIPGSVGGAVYMNAGAFGSSIGELALKGNVIDKNGNIYELNKKDFEFAYRSSRLQKSGEILIFVILKLINGEKEKILRKMNKIIGIRKGKHPTKNIPCAGSYFKNIVKEDPYITGEPAGYYLEKAGTKKLSVGGAAVFGKHANFIVNVGNAKSSDVLKLAEMMKQKVKEMFGIELVEEVVYLDYEEGFKR